MKEKNITEQDIEKLKSMYYQNIPFKDMCLYFNISNTTLNRWLNKYHIKRNRHVYTINANEYSMEKMKKIFTNEQYIPLSNDYNGNHKKYNYNENYFDCIDNQDKAYIIGLLLADGNINQEKTVVSISLQESDKLILNKIQSCVGISNNLIFINMNKKNQNWSNQYCLSLFSKHLCRALCFYGVIPNKSLSLKYPVMIREELTRHILRGYIDGDGNISKNECRVRFVSTKDFCDVAKLIIENTLNINCTIKQCKNNDATKELCIAGRQQCSTFLQWIYKDANLYINRKYHIYLDNYINNSLSA